MGIKEVSETISQEQLKLSSLYNSTVDLLQSNLINNQLFETQFGELNLQARKIDDLNKLLTSFDNKQRSQIVNLEKANEIILEKKEESLVKQQRRIFTGLALGFIVFISFSQRKLLGSLLSSIDKRVLFAILLLIIFLSYRNRSLLIESFESVSSDACKSKKQIDIVRALNIHQFQELAKDLLDTEQSLDKLKNPSSLFTMYSNSQKPFNKTDGEFNLSC
jgi:hypothetical protein